MKKTLSRFACALALAVGASAHAGLVTFDAPTLVDIDPVTNVATYTESGFRFSGDAASYLPLDFIGTGGSGGLLVLANSTLTLTGFDGGLFNLVSLDYGLYDLSALDPSLKLLVHGLFGDNTELNQTLGLGDPASFAFTGWTALKEVTFAANADYVLDNVSSVPEPGSVALVGAALAGLVFVRRRFSRLDAGPGPTSSLPG